MVNNQKRASLDSVCAGEVERLQSACAEKCKNCICFENRLVETNPTMTLTIGDQRIAKDIAFLHGVGWCVKDNLCFQFLLNNGMRLIINAQRRVLLYVGRTYKIDRNMPKECLEELKGVKGLLEEFVK
ncbi:hypothetical protein PAEPH01_1719 [Pancytospora epiphaga]|nr:hypothetical protein PAEPH01_1719 [Pancytospora epiphaga]